MAPVAQGCKCSSCTPTLLDGHALVKLPAVLIVVVATAKGYPRGQRLPIRRQKMPKMKGNQLRLEDLGWKVEGSNPSAGKKFSLKISV